MPLGVTAETLDYQDFLAPEPREADNAPPTRRCWTFAHVEDTADSREWFESPRLPALASDWLARLKRPPKDYAPPASTLKEVAGAIEGSRWILHLENDWDESGSPAYSKSALERAHRFVLQIASSWRKHAAAVSMPVPKILPGPDASIDVHWKSQGFELLVNIPSDLSKPATFYGDDYGNACIRGSFDPSSSRQALSLWLLSFS